MQRARLREMTWLMTSGSKEGIKRKNPPCQSAWRVSETLWTLPAL